MSSSASEARDAASGRLGGARADFVASLGRKLNDARDLLGALEDDPASKLARDELRRRLHALGSAARLLRFEAMARALQEVLAVLDRGAENGGLRPQEVTFLAEVLDDLPALAWGEPPPRDAAPTVTEEIDEERSDTPGLAPISVLVVGGAALADALTEEGAIRVRAFECERTEDAQGALELARAYAPDLVIVDSDVAGAPALVEALLDDPLTEPVPVVVTGSFRALDEESRFIALGVARTFVKPMAADVLRQACDELLDAREGRTIRMTLGEPTLEQLAERLSQELKGALVENVDAAARATRVPLGEGTEVLGALWGAIARVQEIVSQRTKGAVRFGGDAPEGAIALAPWLHHDVAGSDRSAARGRGAAADVRLNGRRVVVADDDPGVTWFISDLLRTAGCEVHEALDGITARDIAFRVHPELVVSDILMPGLDGFALCRALRRDVALRDTPVMLLSWKEDLLQRVRELGASAAAYMRKESDSRAVLARVREVLRPRARIEARLRSEGEVRGRLDDLSPRLLLELVCTLRKNARVAVRDATFLYEIEVRDGVPRKATRTASDGAFQSGERALAMLLAVGAGRFVVASSSEAMRGELTGSLSELLARPLASARGALAATTGARTMEVERIVIDELVLEEYLQATPEPARGVLRRLADGVSPRQLLLAGEASPSLVEDLLTDLAARCAIRGVQGTDGIDLLTPAVEAALKIVTGEVPPHRSVPPAGHAMMPARTSAGAATAPRPTSEEPTPAFRRSADPAPGSRRSVAEPAARPFAAPEANLAARTLELSFDSIPAPPVASSSEATSAPRLGLSFDSAPAPAVTYEAMDPFPSEPALKFVTEPSHTASATSLKAIRARPSPRPPAPHLAGADSEPPERPSPSDDEEEGSPSSLEDAVMRELSDRSPAPGVVHTPAGRPPIVEPGDLRPRSSNPPANHGEAPEPTDEPLLPSIPPDAIVPAAVSNEEFAVAPAVPPESDAESANASEDLVLPPPSERGTGLTETPTSETPGEPVLPQVQLASQASRVPLSLPPEDLHEAPEEPPPAPPRSGLGLLLAFALLVGAVLGAMRFAERDTGTAKPAVSEGTPGTGAGTATAAGAGAGTSVSGSAGAGAGTNVGANAGGGANPGGSAAASDDLPSGGSVPFGYGMLEITAPSDAHVRVDGVDAGAGPLSSSMLRSGYHQVRIDQDGRNSQFVIEVRAGKTTRVKSSPLP